MNEARGIDLCDLAVLLGLLLAGLGAWLAIGAGGVLIVVGLALAGFGLVAAARRP